MSTIGVYSYTKDELVDIVNGCIDIYNKHMLANGVITEAKLEEMNKYKLLLANKTFLGSLWEWFNGSDGANDKLCYWVCAKLTFVPKKEHDNAQT